MEELEASELLEELLLELLEELSAGEVLELCETFVASSFNESTNEPSSTEDLSSSGHDPFGWNVSSCVECSDGAALFLELSLDELELPLAEDLAEELIELVDGGFL